MKGIISSHTALTAYQRQTAVDPVSAPTTAKQSPKEGEDGKVGAARLSISQRARDLALGASEGNLGQVNGAKVEALRAALEAGSLKFDSALVAERMIDQGE